MSTELTPAREAEIRESVSHDSESDDFPASWVVDLLAAIDAERARADAADKRWLEWIGKCSDEKSRADAALARVRVLEEAIDIHLKSCDDRDGDMTIGQLRRARTALESKP